MAELPDDVRALGKLANQVSANTGQATRDDVQNLAIGALRLINLYQLATATSDEWQTAANRWSEQIERTRGQQASVERLAVSVWGVREANSLARSLLSEYDIYPKRPEG